MARTRNIKPGFFMNESLAECDPLARLLFAGLWTIADRDGRLEDRPKRIKAELLPYDNVGCEPLLAQLAEHGFIVRYIVAGEHYIQVAAWARHQQPHVKEQASMIPAPSNNEEVPVKYGASTVQVPDQPGTSTEQESPHPLTLNLDTSNLDVCGAGAPRAQLAAAFWEAYPARNGKKLNKSQAMEGLKHIRDQDWPALMVAVSNYAESGQGPMDAFRFLQAGRWREWLQPAATRFGQNRPPSKAAQSASFLTEVLQQSEAAIERRRQNGRSDNDRANGDSSEVFKHLNPGKRQTS